MNINYNKSNRNKGESLTYIPYEYIVLDIETTGFSPLSNDIIEIAALKIKDNKIIDKYQTLVKPKDNIYINEDGKIEYIDSFISSLTGITNEMLECAPDIENILPTFIAFIDSNILIGHNVHFDINFLYDACSLYCNHTLDNDLVDLLRLSRRLFPDLGSYKLKRIASLFEIDTTGHHRALNDCHITYECLESIKIYLNKNDMDLDNIFTYKRSYSRYLKTCSKDFSFEISENPENILYNKHCTFTGALELLSRNEAIDFVNKLGGICDNSVTKKTNYLIQGNFEVNSILKGNKSSKLKKAEDYILKGQDITIMYENEFYEMVENEVNETKQLNNLKEGE